MRFPRRSLKSISSQSLPSILTLFPTNYGRITATQSPPEDSTRRIEDGIELVPIERQNSSTAKMLSPGGEEKEVVPSSKLDTEIYTKPLPSLPGSRWSRISTRNRVLALLCIQFCIILAIGLSLMSVKGRIIDRHQSSVVQSISIATPSPIPINPPIRRGMFALPIGSPQQQNSGCLAQNNESAAWTCSAGNTLQLSLLPSPAGQVNLIIMTLEPLAHLNTSTYGLQGPNLDPVELTPVIDLEASSYGPAYYFRTTYDRTALLRENQIVAQGEPVDLPDVEKVDIQPGDRPWLCVFNETLIEGFIYVSQNSTLGSTVIGNGTESLKISYLPYVMKLTERVSNSTQPYCVQMLAHENGTLVPTVSDGAMYMLKLSEPGSLSQRLGEAIVQRATEQKRQQIASPNSCRCQWLVQ